MTEFSTVPPNQIRCGYFPACPGCALQDRVLSPPSWHNVKQFFHSVNPAQEIPLHSGAITGWRTRSKLAVRGTRHQPEIGLFKQGTHEVISIPHCPLHHPAITKVYPLILQKMIDWKIDPYNEETLTGAIRYLQFAVCRKSRRIQLAIILNRSARDPLIEKWVKQLYIEGGFHGIWINFQPGPTNRILGASWFLAEGEPYIEERLGEVDIYFHPACFAQAHLPLFEQMLQSIQNSLIPAKRVVEFYAGVGVIGLSSARQSAHVVCTEINPFAQECFLLSRLKLPPEIQKKIDFIPRDVTLALPLIEEAEVVIVDPPRKGLDPALLHQLCQAPHLEQLIYVSCGFDSFRRDCTQLLQHGWTIEKAEGYLFFPGTNQIETLCVFQK